VNLSHAETEDVTRRVTLIPYFFLAPCALQSRATFLLSELKSPWRAPGRPDHLFPKSRDSEPKSWLFWIFVPMPFVLRLCTGCSACCTQRYDTVHVCFEFGFFQARSHTASAA